MDEDTNKIKQHIDTEREELGRSLDEFEYRVKEATDPKAYFDKHPGWFLGAAVAGGFLLSLAFRKAATSDTPSKQFEPRGKTSANSAAAPRFSASTHLHRVSETIENIFDGLVGVVSDKLHSFVADAVPGFREQYDAIERQRGRSA